jgi:hypothetical protein
MPDTTTCKHTAPGPSAPGHRFSPAEYPFLDPEMEVLPPPARHREAPISMKWRFDARQPWSVPPPSRTCPRNPPSLRFHVMPIHYPRRKKRKSRVSHSLNGGRGINHLGVSVASGMIRDACSRPADREAWKSGVELPLSGRPGHGIMHRIYVENQSR